MTIICIARLVRTKRIDQLIQAVTKLPDKLVIIGFGPEERRLKKLAQGKVKFLKNLPRKKLIQVLRRADLFCLPSVVEGFGIVTIEAMACGLPVILADLPVNREITHNGQGALFFEPENAADLAKKITEIKPIYKQKRAEALQLSRSYSWEKIYRQTKAVYETCLHH